MKIKFSHIALAVTLSVGLPQASLALTTHGVRVNAVNSKVFEAVAGADVFHQYWCGASHFARRTLGAGWNDKIHIVRGRGPSETTRRRTAVQFALGAGSKSSDGKSLFVGRLQAGDSMSVVRADELCTLRNSGR